MARKDDERPREGGQRDAGAARSGPAGDPSIGDEAGGWPRSTQFEPTGEGPGSYGPDTGPGRAGGRSRTRREPEDDRRTDERIHDDLSERLAGSNVNTEDVEVAVKDGEVTLSGTVETRWDRRSVEELVAETPGVVEVSNLLGIDSPIDRARRANRVGEDTGEDLHH